MALPEPQRLAELLEEAGVDGWLLTDLEGQCPQAARLVGLEGFHLSRRWFALVSSDGCPTFLVPRVEASRFRAPGREVLTFTGWRSLRESLQQLLRGLDRVAMEYRPLADIPQLSRVDAGTVELIRSLGPEVVSSSDLVQRILGAWSRESMDLHRQAARELGRALQASLSWLRRRLEQHRSTREAELQQYLMEELRRREMVTDHPPIVAFQAHTGDPHYSPASGSDAEIAGRGPLMIDLWARADRPQAPYADMTWMSYLGAPPPAYLRIWEAVRDARDAVLELLNERHRQGRPVEGREADRAARDLLVRRGFGDRFVHRTGHSLGFDGPHGEGANLDDFETCDVRQLRARTGFTVEPGVYDPFWGARTEIDVLLTSQGPEITTPLQHELQTFPAGPRP